MGLQVSHGVHSEVGGIQCGGIHQGEECNLDCPELSGTETPFDREEFLSARLFRFHGGDGQTIRAGIHLAAGAGGAAFGGAEHGVGASAAFRRLLTGPFEGLTEISPRLCRGSFNWRKQLTTRTFRIDSASKDGGTSVGKVNLHYSRSPHLDLTTEYCHNGFLKRRGNGPPRLHIPVASGERLTKPFRFLNFSIWDYRGCGDNGEVVRGE